MRLALALTVAAATLATLAPSAGATCFTREDALGFRYTYCAAPGGPVTTTICFRDVEPCVTYVSGEGPSGT